MHVYIYDSFLSGAVNERTLAKIETRLTDLGLNGKISRVGLMKNISSVVKNELMRGAKTVIAVGNDNTVNEVIGSLVGANVTFGIIPVGDNNNIAKTLGISSFTEACDIISARRMENVDLGVINNCRYFLTEFAIKGEGLILYIDNKYYMETINKGSIHFVNMLSKDYLHLNINKINPSDGLLNIIFKNDSRNKYIFHNKSLDDSFFSFSNLEIRFKNNKVLPDNIKPEMPTTITIKKNALNIIVGKNRLF